MRGMFSICQMVVPGVERKRNCQPGLSVSSSPGPCQAIEKKKQGLLAMCTKLYPAPRRAVLRPNAESEATKSARQAPPMTIAPTICTAMHRHAPCLICCWWVGLLQKQPLPPPYLTTSLLLADQTPCCSSKQNLPSRHCPSSFAYSFFFFSFDLPRSPAS